MNKIAADFEAANPGSKVRSSPAAPTSTRRRCASPPAPTRVPTSISAGPASGLAANMSRRASACRSTNITPNTNGLTNSCRRPPPSPTSIRAASTAFPTPSRARHLLQQGCFEKAGITEEPKTYDELLAAAEKLKAAGIPAITFGGTVNWHVMRLMDVMLETKCGAEKHDALMAMDCKWTEEPCATESFAEMDKWAKNYVLSPFMGIDQAQSFNLFIAGRAAMMLEGDWLVQQAASENHQSRRLRDVPVPDRHQPPLRLRRILLHQHQEPRIRTSLRSSSTTSLSTDGAAGQRSASSPPPRSTRTSSTRTCGRSSQKWLEIFNDYRPGLHEWRPGASRST